MSYSCSQKSILHSQQNRQIRQYFPFFFPFSYHFSKTKRKSLQICLQGCFTGINVNQSKRIQEKMWITKATFLILKILMINYYILNSVTHQIFHWFFFSSWRWEVIHNNRDQQTTSELVPWEWSWEWVTDVLYFLKQDSFIKWTHEKSVWWD